MKYLLFLFVMLTSICANSQSNPLVKFSNPKALHKPNGYSHAAIIDLGNCKMVVLAGQVALDGSGALVGKEDIGLQTEQVFLNIKNAISDAGGNMDQLVKLNYYMLEGQDIQPVRNAREKFINKQSPPVSTLVKVSQLFRDDILIEIEATFILPK